MSPRLKLRDIAFFERPVRFARPFRFGAITINATPQLFVRVEIEVEGRGSAVGAGAELLVPKWFDKRPKLSPAQTVDDLRRSLEIARGLYLARTGFLTRHSICMHRASVPRSQPVRKRTFRRLPRPTALRKSTKRSSTRCSVRPRPIFSTAWPATSPASMRGFRPT